MPGGAEHAGGDMATSRAETRAGRTSSALDPVSPGAKRVCKELGNWGHLGSPGKGILSWESKSLQPPFTEKKVHSQLWSKGSRRIC